MKKQKKNPKSNRVRRKRKPEMKEEQPLDLKYLGEFLPGNRAQRKKLLKTLKELLEEEGEDWVRLNRDRFLGDANFIVRETLF